jgi:hypothetical protein
MRHTRLAATQDPLLRKFLDAYPGQTSYLDWGDDAAFFSAKHRLGDIRAASWGVCRRDVRAALSQGDFVAFFCGQESQDVRQRWDYFYVGVGTVGGLYTREDVWTRDALANYRSFYNILARWSNGHLSRQETFYPPHENWRERAACPYILFDKSLTDFNIDDPLHVATYTGNLPEKWYLDSPRVQEVHRLLFSGRADRKGLRTSRTGYGHSKLNLIGPKANRAARPSLAEIRSELLRLVRVAA